MVFCCVHDLIFLLVLISCLIVYQLLLSCFAAVACHFTPFLWCVRQFFHKFFGKCKLIGCDFSFYFQLQNVLVLIKFQSLFYPF